MALDPELRLTLYRAHRVGDVWRDQDLLDDANAINRKSQKLSRCRRLAIRNTARSCLRLVFESLARGTFEN